MFGYVAGEVIIGGFPKISTLVLNFERQVLAYCELQAPHRLLAEKRNERSLEEEQVGF